MQRIGAYDHCVMYRTRVHNIMDSSSKAMFVCEQKRLLPKVKVQEIPDLLKTRKP